MSTSEHVYRLCLDIEDQLNDHGPDNRCPECGQDITGWEQWDAHWPPDGPPLCESQQRNRERLGVPWPWTLRGGVSTRYDMPCRYDRDLLTARAFRRRYIATHEAARAQEEAA